MNSAAHLWNGTADAAIEVLRDEWSHIHATMAASLDGERIERSAALKAALASITGVYATKLGVLLAASPEQKRAAICAAFEEVLDVATAAKMRGVAAGTWYRFECWIDGKRQPSKQMQCDERGAMEMAKQAERDAFSAGAQDVRIIWKRMDLVGKKRAA